jgi:hypothetical protein
MRVRIRRQLFKEPVFLLMAGASLLICAGSLDDWLRHGSRLELAFCVLFALSAILWVRSAVVGAPSRRAPERPR